jgi:hypothetical protein
MPVAEMRRRATRPCRSIANEFVAGGSSVCFAACTLPTQRLREARAQAQRAEPAKLFSRLTSPRVSPGRTLFARSAICDDDSAVGAQFCCEFLLTLPKQHSFLNLLRLFGE